MKFYLQVREDGIITDAIDYQYSDYIEHEADSLPIGVHGGWYKLENGVIVEHPELRPFNEANELIQFMREQLAMQEQAILELSMTIGGAMNV